MADMTTARTALAARIAAVTGVRVAADGTAPGQITPAPGKPIAVIAPDPGVFITRDSQGSYVFNFAVKLIVATQITDAAQRALDGYIDDVFTAIEDDTADSVLTVLAVVGRSYGAVTYAGEDYPVGAEFAVAVGVV